MPFSDTNEENDDDSPDSASERSSAASRSTSVSVVVNAVLSTAQIVVGVLVAKSQGLIADGKHCLSDLLSDFVVLLGNHASQKDADADHPYGHQRFETAASLALGAILLAVGAGTLWSAAVKLDRKSTRLNSSHRH